jgi:hypothetical protein
VQPGTFGLERIPHLSLPGEHDEDGQHGEERSGKHDFARRNRVRDRFHAHQHEREYEGRGDLERNPATGIH